MKVAIKNVERLGSETKCMFCECNIESIHVKAILNNSTPHSLHIFSCPECPNITFEFVTEQDLAVLNKYLVS